MAWRDTRWIVSRDNVEMGVYAYRAHAMDRARTLAGEEAAVGRRCYLLLREKDGEWSERPCPKPRRTRVAPEAPRD